MLLLPHLSFAQVSEDMNRVFNGFVKDDEGNALKSVNVYWNEGSSFTKTDGNGLFFIKMNEISTILLEAEGFELYKYTPLSKEQEKEFVLQRKSFLRNSVNIPFGEVKQEEVVNGTNSVVINDFSRFDNAQSLSSVIPYLLGIQDLSVRGNSQQPLYIIDGLPRNIYDLNVSEVEQVTVLKDNNAAILYGTKAANGVIMVKTKRGEANRRKVQTTAFYGIALREGEPKYLNSVDYMSLYNEARLNDGLDSLYTSDIINNFKTGNPYRYPNNDYYSDLYLKKYKPFSSLRTELSGGNDRFLYYTNLGWEYTDGLLKIGESQKINRFNLRGNIDLKISDWVTVAIDGATVLSNNKNNPSSLGYWSEASSRTPNYYAPFIPIDLIANKNNELLKGARIIDSKYILGGNQQLTSNAFANIYAGTKPEYITRLLSFNNRINFDLSKITKGLSFSTNLSFDFLGSYTQSIPSQYAVYQATWGAENDSIADLKKFGEDVRIGNQSVQGNSFKRNIGGYVSFNYNRIFQNIHDFSGSLISYLNHQKQQNDLQGEKDNHFGLRLFYGYNGRYFVDFSSALAHSVKLMKGNRNVISPTLGIAWNIHKEDFMSSLKWVNYLKLKASAGIINTDQNFDFYLYEDVYDRGETFYWNDISENKSSVSTRGANSYLGYEKMKDINVGIEGLLFNGFSFEANWFKGLNYDLIIRPTSKYPTFYYSFVPYENFAAISFEGYEVKLSYQKRIADFSIMSTLNFLYNNNRYQKLDETYEYDYQYRVGKNVGTAFGLVANGLFQSTEEIENSPEQKFSPVKPGDIKYVDQNNDNIINSDDMIAISKPAPYHYSVQIMLSYKNLTLFAKGRGSIGSYGYKNSSYFRPSGNDKYSEYALLRWTEETKETAKYPRLSSLSNTNNNQFSTFWQYKSNPFKIYDIQITYNVPIPVDNILSLKDLYVFAEAKDVITFSKYKELVNLRVSTEPTNSSYLLGVKFIF